MFVIKQRNIVVIGFCIIAIFIGTGCQTSLKVMRAGAVGTVNWAEGVRDALFGPKVVQDDLSNAPRRSPERNSLMVSPQTEDPRAGQLQSNDSGESNEQLWEGENPYSAPSPYGAFPSSPAQNPDAAKGVGIPEGVQNRGGMPLGGSPVQYPHSNDYRRRQNTYHQSSGGKTLDPFGKAYFKPEGKKTYQKTDVVTVKAAGADKMTYDEMLAYEKSQYTGDISFPLRDYMPQPTAQVLPFKSVKSEGYRSLHEVPDIPEALRGPSVPDPEIQRLLNRRDEAKERWEKSRRPQGTINGVEIFEDQQLRKEDEPLEIQQQERLQPESNKISQKSQRRVPVGNYPNISQNKLPESRHFSDNREAYVQGADVLASKERVTQSVQPVYAQHLPVKKNVKRVVSHQEAALPEIADASGRIGNSRAEAKTVSETAIMAKIEKKEEVQNEEQVPPPQVGALVSALLEKEISQNVVASDRKGLPRSRYSGRTLALRVVNP